MAVGDKAKNDPDAAFSHECQVLRINIAKGGEVGEGLYAGTLIGLLVATVLA